MMTVSQRSKPDCEPAEVYDELFVPALFARRAPRNSRSDPNG